MYCSKSSIYYLLFQLMLLLEMEFFKLCCCEYKNTEDYFRVARFGVTAQYSFWSITNGENNVGYCS